MADFDGGRMATKCEAYHGRVNNVKSDAIHIHLYLVRTFPALRCAQAAQLQDQAVKMQEQADKLTNVAIVKNIVMKEVKAFVAKDRATRSMDHVNRDKVGRVGRIALAVMASDLRLGPLWQYPPPSLALGSQLGLSNPTASLALGSRLGLSNACG